MKTRKNKLPENAIPVTLWGEDACALADALGIGVDTYALKGSRTISTADARAFLTRLGISTAAATKNMMGPWLVIGHTLL